MIVVTNITNTPVRVLGLYINPGESISMDRKIDSRIRSLISGRMISVSEIKDDIPSDQSDKKHNHRRKKSS